MITKMRHRLTCLYTGTTSLILALILLTVWLYQNHLEEVRLESAFQNYLLELSNKLETDSQFSDLWLARMESSNRLLIHIEDNGYPLFFQGSWIPSTSREQLIQQAKEKALAENIDTSQAPVFQYMKKSSLFSIKGSKNDRYMGMVLVIPSRLGYKSLVLLQDMASADHAAKTNGILFFLMGVTGILILGILSHKILKKAMAPISEYQKRQTEFVAAASHELRSPLSVIQTSVSAIELEPKKTEEMLHVIHQECQRAGNLIKNLLLLASTESRTTLPPPVSVEADTLLLRLYEAYQPLCQKQGIRLSLKLPEDILPPVRSEPGALYQILAIFLDNAMAHGCSSSDGSILYHKKSDGFCQDTAYDKKKETVRTIQLTASVIKNHIQLSVIDHGPGIPEDQKRKIFQSFYQCDPSRNPKEHFGLGLSIASNLAKMACASLSLSDTPCGGTSFHLLLTIVEES